MHLPLPRPCATFLAGLALALAGCRGPAKESAGVQGSLAEIQKRLGDAQPVQAAQVEGEVPLSADPFALAEPGSVQEPAESGPPPRQDPYIRFGERIIVRSGVGGQDFITKPYTVPTEKAQRLVELMVALEPFQFRPRGSVDPTTNQALPLDPGVLEYQVLAKWDEEYYSNLKTPFDSSVPQAPQKIALSDVFVVTASYELLEQFEEFLDLFAAAGVPQIELEAKIIEVVEVDQLDVGTKASLVFGSSNFVQQGAFSLPNSSAGDPSPSLTPGTIPLGPESILDLGAVTSSLAFNALIEAVRTWDNVQIDSRPKTVVRAGGVAYIESTTEVPFLEIKTISADSNFTAGNVYKKVGVQLYISPRLIGTKTLALDVHLIGSQQVGTQATFTPENGSPIDVPVIAYRTAKTVVYLEPGQTLVIGGLTTTRERELVNRVPILGDIPLLGLLFRSKLRRTEKQHVLFAISPRILQHSDFETEF
ncbi:MAG TPA: type II and III secretion system protein [Planctomycetota bacterium]